jgi:hypothetical protein
VPQPHAQQDRPLGISVREALCVIYSVDTLVQFFEKNSLDFDKKTYWQ